MRLGASGTLRMLDVEDVRETNELKLLHLIRDRQPISRADLVRQTGLLAGTVSVIVNRLLRAGVIYEGEEAPSSGGRRPTYLQVNAEKAYVLGISIGVQQTSYAVSDFNGRLLIQRSLRTEADSEAFLTRLGSQFSTLLKTNFQRSRFAAVAVSVPGLIDRMAGCVVRSPNLGWSDVPVRSILEKQLGLPVHVENDANAAALSELWYGPMEVWRAHCMLFVLIVEGIGTGLILNGELYVGSRIGMGGFGHISMDPSGPRCSCGNVGCWEALGSDHAALTRFRDSPNNAGQQVSSMGDLVDLAHSGDECARKELLRTASLIGRGLRGLAHGMAPDVIVIGGQIATAWAMIEPILSSELQSEYLVAGTSKPLLRPASVDQPSLFGAIPIALRTVLQRGKKKRGASHSHSVEVNDE
jgi:predicted NBD/HSP70 family sugar kinase